jgi:hypothetical protein
VRFRRRRDDRPKLPTEKPYLVTIHAEHDQYHTFAMGPGDAVGVGAIRIDIAKDGSIHASPNAVPHAEQVTTMRTPVFVGETQVSGEALAEAVRRELLKVHRRNGPRTA